VRYGVLAPTARCQHLFAHGKVRVVSAAGAATEQGEAIGEHLVLQLGDRNVSGRLTGNPARIVRAGRGDDGEELVGEAPVVLLGHDGTGETLALLPKPGGTTRLTMTQGDARLARENEQRRPIQVTCRGPVRAERDAVRFLGVVHAYAIDEAGERQPGEFDLESSAMTMARNAETGAIESVHAFGAAKLRWRDLDASAEDLWLDLITHLCTVRDEAGNARFGLANRGEWRGFQAEFDYVTHEVARVWGTRLRGGVGSKSGR